MAFACAICSADEAQYLLVLQAHREASARLLIKGKQLLEAAGHTVLPSPVGNISSPAGSIGAADRMRDVSSSWVLGGGVSDTS